jgi:hypothetical protein
MSYVRSLSLYFYKRLLLGLEPTLWSQSNNFTAAPRLLFSYILASHKKIASDASHTTTQRYSSYTAKHRRATFIPGCCIQEEQESMQTPGLYVQAVRINRRLFCQSTVPSALSPINRTVGSFTDQPSARSPVTESTIERTNTRLVGPVL